MEKILIAYFSHVGQNYSYGGIKNLKVGNTEVVAKKLHAMIPSDLFYIDTVLCGILQHFVPAQNSQRDWLSMGIMLLRVTRNLKNGCIKSV